MDLKKFVKHFFKVIYLHSVHSLSAGALDLLPYFQKGGLTVSQFLEGGCWKSGVTFSAGGRCCSFYMKDKVKSELLKDKKGIYKQKCLSAITKNLNWQILTKNLVIYF